MKSIIAPILTGIFALGVFCAIILTSCSNDKCLGVNCSNGGVCASGSCQCPAGFTGLYCQTSSFIGSWKGRDACAPGEQSSPYINLNITATLVADTVLINNAGGFLGNFTGKISPDGKSIIYTSQVVSPSAYTDTVNGTLTLVNDSAFVHSYTISNGATYTCSGSYIRN